MRHCLLLHLRSDPRRRLSLDVVSPLAEEFNQWREREQVEYGVFR